MGKTFNVLCYDKNDTSEKIIVKVKASNYKEAKYLVEGEMANYVAIQQFILISINWKHVIIMHLIK